MWVCCCLLLLRVTTWCYVQVICSRTLDRSSVECDHEKSFCATSVVLSIFTIIVGFSLQHWCLCHMSMHTCTHACATHAHARTHTRARAHTHTHTHTHTHMHPHARVHTRTHTHMHPHARVHTRTHTHTHAPARTRTHTHTQGGLLLVLVMTLCGDHVDCCGHFVVQT